MPPDQRYADYGVKKKEALMKQRVVKLSKKAKEKNREKVESVKEKPDLARELLLDVNYIDIIPKIIEQRNRKRSKKS